MVGVLNCWAPTVTMAYGSDLPLPRTLMSFFIKSLASTTWMRRTPWDGGHVNEIAYNRNECSRSHRHSHATLTSGSGIFNATAGTSLLNAIGNLFGNTIMAPICSTIIRRNISLSPGMSSKSATPTKLKSMSGLFKKNICRPPTSGIFRINGFMTTRIIPCIWKSLMPARMPANWKLMSQSLA